jgi:hypothetical protein
MRNEALLLVAPTLLLQARQKQEHGKPVSPKVSLPITKFCCEIQISNPQDRWCPSHESLKNSALRENRGERSLYLD